MPTADFFAKLGLFFIRDFLDSQMCEVMRSEVRSTRTTQAYIIRDGVEMVDRGSRNTKHVKISKATRAVVKERLLLVKSQVEKHFNLELSDCEEPSFLLYREGDFFRPHRDKHEEGSTTNRQVSVIVFLNSQDETYNPESYAGGQLTLFGLVDDARWKDYGFPLVGEEGLLIAFPSDTVHEVKSVTNGERQTIVSWYVK